MAMPVDIVPTEEKHIDGFHRTLDFVAQERRFLAFLEAPPPAWRMPPTVKGDLLPPHEAVVRLRPQLQAMPISVIASAAKQSIESRSKYGLLRCARNDELPLTAACHTPRRCRSGSAETRSLLPGSRR